MRLTSAEQTLDARLVEARHGREQPLRVGVLRRIKDLTNRPVLLELPALHDEYALAGPCDNGEIVRNQDDRCMKTITEIAHEVENLRLHRYVQSRRGLIGDENLRIQ